MVTPAQIRMARAALKIGVRDLAGSAGVTPATVTRYENEHGGLHAETRDKLQAALEAEGITFEPDNGAGAGVRFRQPAKA